MVISVSSSNTHYPVFWRAFNSTIGIQCKKGDVNNFLERLKKVPEGEINFRKQTEEITREKEIIRLPWLASCKNLLEAACNSTYTCDFEDLVLGVIELEITAFFVETTHPEPTAFVRGLQLACSCNSTQRRSSQLLRPLEQWSRSSDGITSVGGRQVGVCGFSCRLGELKFQDFMDIVWVRFTGDLNGFCRVTRVVVERRGAAVIGSGWLRCDRWTLEGEQASLLDAPQREAHSIETRFQEFFFFQRDITQGAQTKMESRVAFPSPPKIKGSPD
ncbi:hypothetical protein PROFUN_11250 [Planoprotostelium fungivorum]|uniref:Uncharacterized protein n=1 Tax=Planoprotostelium fungivorum TaxID=1890364 RepID=A0A2P6NA51_9EUKA|nr:hypothetical protein PROFUN_11250 [Planoprotostelium fungivorum]